jgi:4a-hydroxytetrahydrobiopterin dehydratase
MKNKIPIFTIDEINENLKEIPLWKHETNILSREYKFNDFNEALGFIDELAQVFLEMDHHPTIKILYNKVIFELNTHSAGDKITEIDFILANEIENKYNDFLK